LSTGDKSLITSITSLAALLSSPLSGPPADGFGRKPVILFCDALFVLGALIQAFARSVPVMVVGRAIVGLAIGAASGIAPLYIAEMSPARWRGRLVTISALFITGGQVVAYIIGWLFASRQGGWRWMVGLGAVPAIVQIGALMFVPESPRWLMKVGKDQTAQQVLQRIYPRNSQVVDSLIVKISSELKEEVEALGIENESLLKRMRKTTQELLSDKASRKALTIACMLQGAQQICGFVSQLRQKYLPITDIRVNRTH
jgi:MFS transporter, SP family, solute carrier family 2 (myo-inositol transporter), member 13